MLAADQVVAALLCFVVPELAALSLAYRVPTDHDISALNQVLAKTLIVSFSVFSVAAGNKHCGMSFVFVIGDVDQRSNVYTGQALEDQLLNMEALHLNPTGDLRIQRRLDGRETPNHLEQLIPHLLLQLKQVLFSFEGGPSGAALFILTPREFRLIPQIWSNRRTDGALRQDAKGVG